MVLESVPMIFVLCLLVFAQCLPGATAAVEPESFDYGAESVVVAEGAKTLHARRLKGIPRDDRPRDSHARIPRQGWALADSPPGPQFQNILTFLPRRSTAGERSPQISPEDH